MFVDLLTISPLNLIRPVMTASDAAVVLFVFSLATVNADKQEVSSANLQYTVLAVHSGRQRVDAVLVALAGLKLSPGTPTKKQVDRFVMAMVELETLANEVRDHAVVMQSQGDEYFRRWDQELAKLQDKSLVSLSLSRKQAVQVQFSKLRARYVQVNADFAQFLPDLRVISDLLAHDLTPTKIMDFKCLHYKTTVIAPRLNESLVTLAADFKSLGHALTFVSQLSLK